MIVLFTDYGVEGPYLGQVCNALHQAAPGVPVVNLLADAPPADPRASAYLLAAFDDPFAAGTVFLCVVDPGVGSGRDPPVILRAEERWYVGPDNGLFDIVGRRARSVQCWDITWRPRRLSETFHGRDLYAPMAAQMARGSYPPGRPRDWRPRHEWREDLYEIIYFDRFGNAMTGLRAARVRRSTKLKVNGRSILHARTFSAVKQGRPFWYENSSGLVEIAVNRGSAREVLELQIGDAVKI
jgi:hypothetical protein